MIESILTGAGKGLAIALALFVAVVWAFKQGQKDQEADSNEQIIDDFYLAKQARNDPDKRDAAKRMFKRTDK